MSPRLRLVRDRDTARKALEIQERLLGLIQQLLERSDRHLPYTDSRPEGYEEALAKGEQYIRDHLETVKSGQAGKLISPTSGSGGRSAIKNLRDAGKLIGLPVGKRPDYLYPVFQFDVAQCRVRPVVAYTNQLIMANEDPYGSATWWITPTDLLDGVSPLDALNAGELTESLVDAVIRFSQQGM
ncbi:hypothetical protein IEU95_08610 [Hoyosella rhizosphaerae]|nr:hypothetical protein [Hoyosella rhizosphaerae]MBN4926890.1 hypothetical protein [Hoyosella rhizosphaerae]